MSKRLKHDSHVITSYLKGLTIIIVCLDHYFFLYAKTPIYGYGTAFISIFFILSGYGIYHSLSRYQASQKQGLIIHFYSKRLLRIYPLFWLWCLLNGFPNGFLGFFALDFIHTKSPWFIPAILQCYMIAPFVFLSFLYSYEHTSCILEKSFPNKDVCGFTCVFNIFFLPCYVERHYL